jgi:hypothetical protein
MIEHLSVIDVLMYINAEKLDDINILKKVIPWKHQKQQNYIKIADSVFIDI